ncbi:MAG: calcium-binding protein [Planctomycetota bacterium]
MTERLDAMIAEATVDCYNESEMATGLYTMLEEHLAVPFETTVLGVDVVVERIDLNDANDIVAVCRRGRFTQRIPVTDTPLPSPAPKGAEWIDAWRRWIRGG